MPLANDCPIPDPIDLLTFVAACTTTLGLATGVLVMPAHNAVTLAKRLATLDSLSGGRVRLGVGVGWMREELEACGADFESRGRRLDESIDVLRTLWADSGPEGANFEGEFFRFSSAHSIRSLLVRAASRSTSAGTPRRRSVERASAATGGSRSD